MINLDQFKLSTFIKNHRDLHLHLKFTLAEARVTLRTPEVARAETRTRTVPLRKSAGACPSTPVIATEELAAVPATHFPPDPQTG